MTRVSATRAPTSAPPCLDRTATPNDVNAFNAQELTALWLAIDSSAGSSSSSDDNDDGCNGNDKYHPARHVAVRAVAPVSGRDSSSSASTKSCSSSESGSPTAATDVRTAAEQYTTTATTAAPSTTKRKPRTFTAAQVDQRRRRNRDSMRRVRQRKQVEVDHLRQHMELLQSKLDELRNVRAQTVSPSATVACNGSSSSSAVATPAAASSSPHPRRSDRDVHALLERIKTLQLEQLGLHDAILNHQQVTASLVQVVNESKSLLCDPRDATTLGSLTTDSSHAVATDAFEWVDDVLPLLPPLLSSSAASVVALVRESYLAIAEHVQHADLATLERAHDVLGWSDRRVVSDGGWADFVFTKAFAHEALEPLVARTWRVLTDTDQRGGFQSQGLQLKVLARLNADTLVMARTAYAPLERRHYSSIYVLLRVQTADGGCLIGGRTIDPLPAFAARFTSALGPDRAYAHMCYGLQFNRLAESARVTSEGSGSRDTSAQPLRFAPHGCCVQYGGRLGNGSTLMAKTWAMDVLLAALRWENACVQPLYRLNA